MRNVLVAASLTIGLASGAAAQSRSDSVSVDSAVAVYFRQQYLGDAKALFVPDFYREETPHTGTSIFDSTRVSVVHAALGGESLAIVCRGKFSPCPKADVVFGIMARRFTADTAIVVVQLVRKDSEIYHATAICSGGRWIAKSAELQSIGEIAVPQTTVAAARISVPQQWHHGRQEYLP